jgi:hypothetical protein
MKKLLLFVAVAMLLFSCQEKKGDETKTENTAPQDTEFADAKYMDWGKKMLGQFESGDVDGYMGHYADNAVHLRSSGDSIAGKSEIAKFWKDRRGNVIETIKFSNDIWLPLKVNQPQSPAVAPGVWLLSWYQVDVKYKNAASPLTFWIHNAHHYDANDKIDRTVQYIDMAPINKALGVQ